MQDDTQRKRAGKRLLVAAIGVATVSYVSTQSGCAAESDATDEGISEDVAPYDDEESGTEIESQGQALNLTGVTKTSIPVKTGISLRDRYPIKIKWPPVGNLVPPPVGNLMAPPVVVRPPVGNLVPPPVGNLMAPPIDVIRGLEGVQQLAKVK